MTESTIILVSLTVIMCISLLAMILLTRKNALLCKRNDILNRTNVELLYSNEHLQGQLRTYSISYQGLQDDYKKAKYAKFMQEEDDRLNRMKSAQETPKSKSKIASKKKEDK
ncbi:MAG: hypothetical protein LBV67_07110 [Streptococcaceae bacterium]|jgi:hypothetical protein|nr:hypothetical protein [Streptococcaceae bacterium]